MIHVQIWSGSHSARITDMTYAGKRGKTCRVLRFQGDEYHRDDESSNATLSILAAIKEFPADMPFDAAAECIKAMIDAAYAAGVNNRVVAIDLEEIRGVDAPREKLTAGVNGKWSARADNDGIGLYDHEDRCNEPAMITAHRQSANKAYEIARKCWPLVAAAPTFHAAGEILRQHGANLHYYCRMD